MRVGLQKLGEEPNVLHSAGWDSGRGPGLRALQCPIWRAVTAGLRSETFLHRCFPCEYNIQERCLHQWGHLRLARRPCSIKTARE